MSTTNQNGLQNKAKSTKGFGFKHPLPYASNHVESIDGQNNLSWRSILGEALDSKEIVTPICAIKLPHANILTFHTIFEIHYHNNRA